MNNESIWDEQYNWNLICFKSNRVYLYNQQHPLSNIDLISYAEPKKRLDIIPQRWPFRNDKVKEDKYKDEKRNKSVCDALVSEELWSRGELFIVKANA